MQKPSRNQRRSVGPVRSEGSRAAIIDAAIRIAEEDGYAAATIEKIARRAGSGKQTIYRWYGSKAALYVDAYASLVPTASIAKSTGDAEDDLTYLLTALFDVYRTTVAGRILAGLVGASAEDTETADQIRSGLMVGRSDVLRAPLENAISAGTLPREFNIDAAIESTIAMVWYDLLIAPATLDKHRAASIARRTIVCGTIR